MSKKIYYAIIISLLFSETVYSREWQVFPVYNIVSDLPETIHLNNIPSSPYPEVYGDQLFRGSPNISWRVAVGSSAQVYDFTVGFIVGVNIYAYLDDESGDRIVLANWTGKTSGSKSFEGSFLIPSSVETGEASYFGARKFRIAVHANYHIPDTHDRYRSTYNETCFDYYMFEAGPRTFYVDNLDPSNPSIVDQLKKSNVLAKWGGLPSQREPIVVVEGYDPKNNNFPGWYYNAGKDLFDRARNEGHDVYILNFAEGGNTMATSRNNPLDDVTYTYTNDDEVVKYGNASVVQDAVRFVRTNAPHPINKVILAGLSMGGVVSRYALAAAEHVGNPLPVSHFLSIDAPQQYATIDYDLMDFVFTKPLSQNGLRQHYSDLPYDNRPSILSYHATLELLWNNPASGYDLKAEVAPSKNHNSFYKQLNKLNGESRGYPSLCKNLGVSFSTYNGELLNGAQGDIWLTVEIEAHGDVTFDYTFGSVTEHLDYEGSVDLIENKYNKRILYAGSRLPLSYTNINVVDENYSMSRSMLKGMLSFDANIVVRFDTDTKIQPTFIPFVSALDLYDPTFRNSEDKAFLYPQSTYLFVGKSLTSDNSFNFSYAGNHTNFPNPLTQRNYEDDTGVYWPQSTETGEEDLVAVRSRFDEILFNRTHGEYGTDHDIFPGNYIDGIFNFINDKVTEDVSTLNNTWKNKAVLTRDIDVRYGNTLYINKGVRNAITITSDKGEEQVNLNVKSGASVVFEDNTTLDIYRNIHINFEPGSKLNMGDNCSINLYNLSNFVINEGVEVIIGDNVRIKPMPFFPRFIWKSMSAQ